MNIGQTFQWLGRAKIFWRFLFLTILVIGASDWVACRYAVPRAQLLPYAGWILEMAGVLAAVYGLNKKFDSFGEPGSLTRIRSWLGAFPLFRSDLSLEPVTVKLTVNSPTIDIAMTPIPDSSASRERRLLFLETAVVDLYRRSNEADKQSQKSLDSITTDFEADIKKLEQRLREAHEQSKDAQVGDVGMEYAGFAWIMVGLSAATVPEWFAKFIGLFAWFPCL